MKHLRNPSPRPGLLVDPRAFGIGERATKTLVGTSTPWGRERIQSTLPFGSGPIPFLSSAVALQDPRGFYIADPDGNLIGEPALWVGRMLSVVPTEDTRRF